MAQKQQQVSNPLSVNEADTLLPQSLKHKVEIIYGANGGEFEVTPGATFNEILADGAIREALNYGSIKNDANVTLAVDGEIVTGDYVIKGTEQQLEVLRRMGEKA